MVNTIMRFCRETNEYSFSHIANHLGISIKEYIELEEGVQLLSSEQTELLGQLYKVNGDYFFGAAMQLESIWSKSEIIKGLRAEIKRLQSDLPRTNNDGKYLIVFKNEKRLPTV